MEAALDFETLIEMLVDDIGYYVMQLIDLLRNNSDILSLEYWKAL